MAWKGALSKSLQELRIHLCQTGAGSAGAREFVHRNYAELKQANPHFPILIREAAGVEAKLVARYEHGVEKAVSVQNDAPAAITSKLQALVSSAPK